MKIRRSLQKCLNISLSEKPDISKKRQFQNRECKPSPCGKILLSDDGISPTGRFYISNIWQIIQPEAKGERIPDIEGNEDAYNVQYIETVPGDVIVHHYRTLHGFTGNTDPSRDRRAVALRYGGEDLRHIC